MKLPVIAVDRPSDLHRKGTEEEAIKRLTRTLRQNWKLTSQDDLQLTIHSANSCPEGK